MHQKLETSFHSFPHKACNQICEWCTIVILEINLVGLILRKILLVHLSNGNGQVRCICIVGYNHSNIEDSKHRISPEIMKHVTRNVLRNAVLFGTEVHYNRLKEENKRFQLRNSRRLAENKNVHQLNVGNSRVKLQERLVLRKEQS